jgi:hypothetical protein
MSNLANNRVGNRNQNQVQSTIGTHLPGPDFSQQGRGEQQQQREQQRALVTLHSLLFSHTLFALNRKSGRELRAWLG